jgi:hypothetical protein
MKAIRSTDDGTLVDMTDFWSYLHGLSDTAKLT